MVAGCSGIRGQEVMENGDQGQIANKTFLRIGSGCPNTNSTEDTSKSTLGAEMDQWQIIQPTVISEHSLQSSLENGEKAHITYFLEGDTPRYGIPAPVKIVSFPTRVLKPTGDPCSK